jgi:hypothetical protein
MYKSRSIFVWAAAVVLTAVAAVLLVALEPSPALAGTGNPNPRVLPPGSYAYGKTYGEWGAAWWQWALSFPYLEDPINDPTGEFNEQHQSGPVWFLAGTGGGTATRTVTIPPGKGVFLPIINVLNDYPCPDPDFQPGEGQTLEEFLTEGAAWWISNVTELEVEVDGVSLNNLFDYRGTSGLFTFTGDPSWDAVDPCVTGQPQFGVADGYWIMLAPLPKGQHTIHSRGKAVFPEWGDWVFESEVTYNLTVTP